jgi:membrane protease YdiL (CAAX protease family)
VTSPAGESADCDDAAPPAPPPVTVPLGSAPSPLGLRCVIGLLLVWGAVSWVDTVNRWADSGMVVTPGLVGPLAAWGLWRRSRIWWLLTLGLLWTTVVAMIAVAIAHALGPGVRLTMMGVHPTEDPRVVAAALLVVTSIMLGVHRLLTRPDVRGLFPPRPDRTWGPALSLTVAGVILVLGQVTGGLAAAMLLELPPGAQTAATLLTNGRFLTLASVVSGSVTIVLATATVVLRGGAPLREAFALRPVGARVLALWLGVTLLALVVAVTISEILDHPQSAFVLETYRSADPRWLFWLAIVVVAPLAEELVFRGFLFTDLAAAGLRPATVVLITTVFFASLHLGQYAAADFALVTALGFLLGTARARTGSVRPSIAMHVLMNGWALFGAAMTID